MLLDDAAATRKVELALEATAKGKVLFSAETAKDDFNHGCDHVHGLLHDSHRLYAAGSFATSVFLSITAMEEIAKLDIAVCRHEKHTIPLGGRSDDLVFSHKAKHAIALQEVIAIGERLPKAIGEESVRRLLAMGESGRLVELRESALYADCVDGHFVCPSEKIQKEAAREILLLALEVWDDRLVGLTEHTYEIDSDLVLLFDEVAKS